MRAWKTSYTYLRTVSVAQQLIYPVQDSVVVAQHTTSPPSTPPPPEVVSLTLLFHRASVCISPLPPLIHCTVGTTLT